MLGADSAGSESEGEAPRTTRQGFLLGNTVSVPYTPQRLLIVAKAKEGCFNIKLSGKTAANPGKHTSIFDPTTNKGRLSMDDNNNHISAFSVDIPVGAQHIVDSMIAVVPGLKDRQWFSREDAPSFRKIRSFLDDPSPLLDLTIDTGQQGGGGAAGAAEAVEDVVADSAAALNPGERPSAKIVRSRMQYGVWCMDCVIFLEVAMVIKICGSCGRTHYICPFKSRQTLNRHTAADIENDAYLWRCCLPLDFDYTSITGGSLKAACREGNVHEYCLDCRGFYFDPNRGGWSDIGSGKEE